MSIRGKFVKVKCSGAEVMKFKSFQVRSEPEL